ncbi:hypothetical protein AOQ84DRAFT_213703 [Glonium stellatum]|uniref:Uncharacterized protein n=1 Tax=Glonium stellatum TaxID=574774 RepID=A0A8E2F4T0_9PEZI|nr:hypothetical protein AOQ84DRAFT_213703 [Glonium stellatum]
MLPDCPGAPESVGGNSEVGTVVDNASGAESKALRSPLPRGVMEWVWADREGFNPPSPSPSLGDPLVRGPPGGLPQTSSGGMAVEWLGPLVLRSDVVRMNSSERMALAVRLQLFQRLYAQRERDGSLAQAEELANFGLEVLNLSGLRTRVDREGFRALDWFGQGPRLNSTALDGNDRLFSEALYSMFYLNDAGQNRWSRAGLILMQMSILCDFVGWNNRGSGS